ncbi:hypothetical protein MNBD_BACTEROID05-1034 [hydrothermal vent metagenome]|uniref:Uncharacterized protein n=1 Tax=hydrothermal vent metagenome TaxID=652676 RepID=A0A3B0TLT6_9ZZZZ
MKNKKPLIIGIAVFILIFELGIKPHLFKRDTFKKMTAILSFWKEGSFSDVLYYFENKNNSLPTYALSSYLIKKHKIQKKKGGKIAVFIVTLNFPNTDMFPSGKDWEIIMSNRAGGWKITSINLTKN